jgi:uncharacterized protein YqgV (UPF0045/DUF77 family)
MGTPTASVSNEVAAVQRLMKASGLSYSMHSAGTTVGMPLSVLISTFPETKHLSLSITSLLLFRSAWARHLLSCVTCTPKSLIGQLDVHPSLAIFNFKRNHFILCLKQLADKKAEGSWDEVMKLIGQAHTLVHQNGV